MDLNAGEEKERNATKRLLRRHQSVDFFDTRRCCEGYRCEVRAKKKKDINGLGEKPATTEL